MEDGIVEEKENERRPIFAQKSRLTHACLVQLLRTSLHAGVITSVLCLYLVCMVYFWYLVLWCDFFEKA